MPTKRGPDTRFCAVGQRMATPNIRTAKDRLDSCASIWLPSWYSQSILKQRWKKPPWRNIGVTTRQTWPARISGKDIPKSAEKYSVEVKGAQAGTYASRVTATDTPINKTVTGAVAHRRRWNSSVRTSIHRER